MSFGKWTVGDTPKVVVVDPSVPDDWWVYLYELKELALDEGWVLEGQLKQLSQFINKANCTCGLYILTSRSLPVPFGFEHWAVVRDGHFSDSFTDEELEFLLWLKHQLERYVNA